MDLQWFRNKWKGNNNLKAFDKGQEIAGGSKFPLTRGVLQNVKKMTDELKDHTYMVKDSGKNKD